MGRRTLNAVLLVCLLFSLACQSATTRLARAQDKPGPAPQVKLAPTVEKVIDAARAQIEVTLVYDRACGRQARDAA